MVTTKKTAIEYTQKEVREEFKCSLQKNQLKHKKKTVKQDVKDKNAIIHIKNKQHNTELSPSSVITLHVNRLTAPIKRQILAEWIKTHDSTICYLKETHLRSKTQIV